MTRRPTIDGMLEPIKNRWEQLAQEWIEFCKKEHITTFKSIQIWRDVSYDKTLAEAVEEFDKIKKKEKKTTTRMSRLISDLGLYFNHDFHDYDVVKKHIDQDVDRIIRIERQKIVTKEFGF